MLKYKIQVTQPGNALSIIATYPFSEMQMSLLLTDDSTGSVIAREKSGPIEDAIQLSKNRIDMASYIEEDSIDEGTYTLEIEVPRAYFLLTKEFETCLGFDLTIEYVRRKGHSVQQAYSQADNANSPFDVVSVRPPELDKLWLNDERTIYVVFDRPVTMDDISTGRASTHQICQLVSENDQSNLLSPHEAAFENQ